MDRLGIAIGAESVRAVAVRRGVIRWALEVGCDDGAFDLALAELLIRAPRRRPFTRAVVAFGPAHAQTTKVIADPSVLGHSAVSKSVAEDPSGYFLADDPSKLVTSTAVGPDGALWAAAFDESAIDIVIAACNRARLRLAAVIPSVAGLGAVAPEGAGAWRDGSFVLDLAFSGGRLARARRMMANGVASEAVPADQLSTSLDQSLGVLGDNSHRFADAYGAAISARSIPLGLSGPRIRRRDVPAWRVGTAAFGLVVSGAWLILAPGLGWTRRAEHTLTRLEALESQAKSLSDMERGLDSVGGALSQVAGFRARHSAPLEILESLTRVLPDSSMVVTLRIGPSGGTAVILSSALPTLLARLERVTELTKPMVTGPVVREMLGGHELDRATIAFRLPERRREENDGPSR